MSAWIVSRNHVDTLVYWADTLGLIADRDATGQMLWAENVKSVHARYGDPNPDTLPGAYDGMTADIAAYTFAMPKPLPADGDYYLPFDPLDANQIPRVIDCFEYQSCEHVGWSESESRKLLNRMRALLPADDDSKSYHWGV